MVRALERWVVDQGDKLALMVQFVSFLCIERGYEGINVLGSGSFYGRKDRISYFFCFFKEFHITKGRFPHVSAVF